MLISIIKRAIEENNISIIDYIVQNINLIEFVIRYQNDELELLLPYLTQDKIDTVDNYGNNILCYTNTKQTKLLINKLSYCILTKFNIYNNTVLSYTYDNVEKTKILIDAMPLSIIAYLHNILINTNLEVTKLLLEILSNDVIFTNKLFNKDKNTLIIHELNKRAYEDSIYNY